MKTRKKVLALLMAMLLLVAALPVSAVFAASADMRYGREKLGQMQNGANLQFVYDQLVSGCGNAKAEIVIDISGRGIDMSRDLDTVCTMLYSDYPEYFWMNGIWDISAVQQGSTVILTMKPTYTITGSALTSAKTAYEAKVNQLTAGLSGSDYDKAKTLHDRLIDTVTYTNTANDQNAYGALVEGKAVCNGYARAYQHLLMKAGIPAWYIIGTSNDPSTNTPVDHAWNLVKIDGQWYYTDITWDDQGANTFYAYFHITTQQLLQGHAIGAKYAGLVPSATATSANYYVKEGRVFDAYDQAKLVALLKKDNNKTQIYISGDLGSFIRSLDANLLSIAADLGATGNYHISYNSSRLGNAVMLDVILTQEGHVHTDAADSTQSTVPTDSTQSTEPANSIPDTEPTDSTQSTEPANSIPDTEPADGTQSTEPTGSTSDTEPTGNTQSTESTGSAQGADPTTDSSPVTEPTQPDSHTDSKTGSGALIWIAFGSAAVVAAGIGAAVILKSKKKSK